MGSSTRDPLQLLLLLITPTLLLFLATAATATATAPPAWRPAERDALIALRDALDDAFLYSNWTGPQCLSDHATWYGLRCRDGRVIAVSLESMGLSARLTDPLILANLAELTLVSFKNNTITGKMLDFSSNPKLRDIDFSVNRLAGPISFSLLGLDRLQSLQLAENELSGLIPPLNQTTLKSFNVSYNKLTGKIPSTGALHSFGESSYTGNPGLCGAPTRSPCRSVHDTIRSSKEGFRLASNPTVLTLFVVLDSIGFVALVWSIYVFCRKKMKKSSPGEGKATKDKSTEASDDKMDDTRGSEERRDDHDQSLRPSSVGQDQRRIVFVGKDVGAGFELSDLLKASAEGLGRGSFGSCYKAVLEDGRAFVVKRMRELSPMTDEEFAKQMRFLAAIQHPNLLPLIGYYYSMNEKLLIFNMARNGNLFDRIHGGRGGGSRIPFRWNSRLAVARAVARAMEFLHRSTKHSSSAAPHGDLKSSNVLLDANNVALVSDYGLLPIVSAPLASQRMSAYRSPEYQHGRKISRKSDVWCYGCLLLELMTGRVPSSGPDPRGGGRAVELSSWVEQAVREEWTVEVFDGEIRGQGGLSAAGMFTLLRVAMWCCDKTPERRPEMAEVVREVEEIGLAEVEEADEDEEEEESEPSTSSHGSGSGNERQW